MVKTYRNHNWKFLKATWKLYILWYVFVHAKQRGLMWKKYKMILVCLFCRGEWIRIFNKRNELNVKNLAAVFETTQVQKHRLCGIFMMCFLVCYHGFRHSKHGFNRRFRFFLSKRPKKRAELQWWEGYYFPPLCMLWKEKYSLKIEIFSDYSPIPREKNLFFEKNNPKMLLFILRIQFWRPCWKLFG